MKMNFRGEFFSYVDSKEEAEEIIKNYQRITFVKYQEFKALYDGIQKAILGVRKKGTIETNSEYRNYLENNHQAVIAGLEKLGEMIFPDGFDSIYFYNSEDLLVGYKIAEKTIPFTLLPLKAALYFPKKDEFTLI